MTNICLSEIAKNSRKQRNLIYLQTKHELLVVKCLLSTSFTQTVLISAVPERGDAEGEGAGGPGGWRVQETAGGRGQQGGGGKEVSRK